MAICMNLEGISNDTENKNLATLVQTLQTDFIV
jgi:hypothetical protein